ncbi:unnamed protein product [Amoebophrya sp. A25]|nr:unnamed protein product [Amoebophrya sp. A25]|eukprot:GSA25T00006326001.1
MLGLSLFGHGFTFLEIITLLLAARGTTGLGTRSSGKAGPRDGDGVLIEAASSNYKQEGASTKVMTSSSSTPTARTRSDNCYSCCSPALLACSTGRPRSMRRNRDQERHVDARTTIVGGKSTTATLLDEAPKGHDEKALRFNTQETSTTHLPIIPRRTTNLLGAASQTGPSPETSAPRLIHEHPDGSHSQSQQQNHMNYYSPQHGFGGSSHDTVAPPYPARPTQAHCSISQPSAYDNGHALQCNYKPCTPFEMRRYLQQLRRQNSVAVRHTREREAHHERELSSTLARMEQNEDESANIVHDGSQSRTIRLIRNLFATRGRARLMNANYTSTAAVGGHPQLVGTTTTSYNDHRTRIGETRTGPRGAWQRSTTLVARAGGVSSTENLHKRTRTTTSMASASSPSCCTSSGCTTPRAQLLRSSFGSPQREPLDDQHRRKWTRILNCLCRAQGN